MTKQYTISEQSYNQVNNGRIKILNVRDELEGILHPDTLAKINQGLEEMHQGLQELHKQEVDQLEAEEKHIDQVDKEKGPFMSIWSIPDVNLYSEHNLGNIETLVYKEHWGGVTIETQIDGTRWVDLWRAAERAINETGDTHHVFVENFVRTANPNEVELLTGS